MKEVISLPLAITSYFKILRYCVLVFEKKNTVPTTIPDHAHYTGHRPSCITYNTSSFLLSCKHYVLYVSSDTADFICVFFLLKYSVTIAFL